jgi:hypothetical protein
MLQVLDEHGFDEMARAIQNHVNRPSVDARFNRSRHLSARVAAGLEYWQHEQIDNGRTNEPA